MSKEQSEHPVYQVGEVNTLIPTEVWREIHHAFMWLGWAQSGRYLSMVVHMTKARDLLHNTTGVSIEELT